MTPRGERLADATALQPGYLLHSRDFRDTSLIVELFTPAGGRFSAVARGARQLRRGISQRGLLQPFQPLWLAVGGRGELRNLLSLEARGAPPLLQGRALFSALYLNELLQRLLPRDDPHPELFDLYESLLALLAAGGDLERPLRSFELALLAELGYGLSITVDAEGEPLAAERWYRFEPARGLLPARGGEAGLLAGADLLAFAAGSGEEGARRALKRLTRLALQPHLGDRPLASRALFRN